MEYFRSYRYRNLTLFIVSIIIAIVLSRVESFHTLLLSIGDWGYFGAFLAGILFVSTFTVATGALILLILAERLSAVEIGIIAGLGAVLGDLLIFRFVKDNLVEEVTPLYNKLGGKHVSVVLHSRYFSWLLPVVGAIIVASPLPDEVGVSMMGLSKMKSYQFVIVSFVLNAIGIFLVVSASNLIKP